MDYQTILEENKKYLRFANVTQDQDTEFIMHGMIVLDNSAPGYVYEILNDINESDKEFIAEFNEIRDDIEPIEEGIELWEFAENYGIYLEEIGEEDGILLEEIGEEDDEIGFLEANRNGYRIVRESDLKYPLIWSIEK